MIRKFFALFILIAAGVDAQTLTLPEPVVNKGVQTEFDVRTGVYYGMQNILLSSQPQFPQLEADVRMILNDWEVYVQAGGLDRFVWGVCGVRRQWLRQEVNGLNLTAGYSLSIPSWTMYAMMLQTEIGTKGEHWGWTAGVQGGMCASVMPNQRPMGPNALLSVYGSVHYSPAEFVAFVVEAASSPLMGYFNPGVIVRLFGVELLMAMPVNVLFVPSLTVLSPIPAFGISMKASSFTNTRRSGDVEK